MQYFMFMNAMHGCRCSKLRQRKLNKGKYKVFSFSVNENEVTIVCPKKTAKNINNAAELEKAFNNKVMQQVQHAAAYDQHNLQGADEAGAAGPQPQEHVQIPPQQ